MYFWKLPALGIMDLGGSLPLAVSWAFVLLAAWKLSKGRSKPFVSKSEKLSKIAWKKMNGYSAYWPAVLSLFVLVMISLATYSMISAPRVTFYGLKVQRIVGKDSMVLISPETGPFRADFCPDVQIQKYEPREGYVMCRLVYRDRGCLDIVGHNGSITWVKDQLGWTTTLRDGDSFKPFPVCEKEN